jgi:hypothetical protein
VPAAFVPRLRERFARTWDAAVPYVATPPSGSV